jgi:hypothetical protein
MSLDARFRAVRPAAATGLLAAVAAAVGGCTSALNSGPAFSARQARTYIQAISRVDIWADAGQVLVAVPGGKPGYRVVAHTQAGQRRVTVTVNPRSVHSITARTSAGNVIVRDRSPARWPGPHCRPARPVCVPCRVSGGISPALCRPTAQPQQAGSAPAAAALLVLLLASRPDRSQGPLRERVVPLGDPLVLTGQCRPVTAYGHSASRRGGPGDRPCTAPPKPSTCKTRRQGLMGSTDTVTTR